MADDGARVEMGGYLKAVAQNDVFGRGFEIVAIDL
jgi:hypothetical protein